MIRWRTLFDQYDPEGFGEIPWPDFMVLLARGDFREEVVNMMTMITMAMTTGMTPSWPLWACEMSGMMMISMTKAAFC